MILANSGAMPLSRHDETSEEKLDLSNALERSKDATCVTAFSSTLSVTIRRYWRRLVMGETIQTELIILCSRREMSLDAISSTLRILLASKENVGQRNDFIFKDAANYCCKNVSSQNSSKINIVF